jgi:hypothetical protein
MVSVNDVMMKAMAKTHVTLASAEAALRLDLAPPLQKHHANQR